MKKLQTLLCLLLCLCLPLTAAMGEGVNQTLYSRVGAEDYNAVPNVTDMCAVGDTLYLLLYDYSAQKCQLAAWKPGEAEATVSDMAFVDVSYVNLEATDGVDAEGKPTVNYLFSDGEKLYGLNGSNGEVWTLVDQSGVLATAEKGATLQWDGIVRKATDYTYLPNFNDFAVMDGKLYLCTSDWEQNELSELFVWDLATGVADPVVSNKFLKTLSPYRDGKLLCVVYDSANAWDEATNTVKAPDVGTYDPKTGETTILFPLTTSNGYGLRYSAAKDAAYYSYGGKVYRLSLTDGASAISAYLPQEVWEDSGFELMGELMAISSWSGVVIRTLDAPEIAAGALTIYGEYGSDAHMAVVNAHPEMPVTFTQNYYDTLEAFTNAMVSGSDAMDVLRLDSNYTPLARLIDKGYAMDLSGYTDLVALVDEMYPQFADVCKRDGKLYAVPVGLDSSSCLGFDADALEALGLTNDDLPKTVYELLDFVENWQYDYGEEHEEIRLLDDTNAKSSLLNYIMAYYFTYCKQQNITVDLSSDLFRKLMTKLDGIDFSGIDPVTDANGNVADEDDYWSKLSLFNTWASATYVRGGMRRNMLLLPLDEGLEPAITGNLTVLVVNPRTTRAEQAAQYLLGYMQNVDKKQDYITLYPNHNDAIVNTSFESDLAQWHEYLDAANKALETAEPENMSNIKDDVTYWESRIANADQYKFDVSAEAIASYRESVAPYLVITGQTALNTWDKDGNNDLYTQIQQYVQGAITADQFIKEAGNRLRMMALEDQ